MPNVFETHYEGHHIWVENRWFQGEKLYIDDTLQDENVGMTLRGTLAGEVTNREGEKKTIKVSLGGITKIQCKIFAGHELIYP